MSERCKHDYPIDGDGSPGDRCHECIYDEGFAAGLEAAAKLAETYLKTSEQMADRSHVDHVTRGDLEIAWLEQRYVDAEYKRDARFRVALARGPVLCLISMNYRSDSAAELEPVWDEVLRTLVTGVRVEDPTARVRH